MGKLDSRLSEQLKQGKKLSRSLVGILERNNEKVDALVRVRNPLQLSLLERRFEVTSVYPFISSICVKCDVDDAIRLLGMREVEYVCAQGRACALDIDERSVTNEFFRHSNRINYPAFDFCEGLSGEGVTLCVMDTGINVHADLSVPEQRIIHFEDMINGNAYPYDDNGHGTFVTGVACGNGIASGKEISGIAPRANILGIKVIDKSGESGTFKILDGMQWLFDNYRRYGVRVVCMSFGAEPTEYADPLKIGVEMLVRSGLIVVVASGNSGENSLKSPAISGEVIAVGAVDESQNVAQFSSRGAYNGIKRPDVYAPGVNVRGIKVGGCYSSMSGTSVSAPYVAGACCLLCQRYKGITPFQAKIAILNHSRQVNGVRIFQV